MFLVVVTVDKQTGNLVGRPEIVTRGFVAGADDPRHRRRRGPRRAAIANPGDHTSEPALLKAQIKDSLSQYLFERTDADRWSSRSWSRSRRHRQAQAQWQLERAAQRGYELDARQAPGIGRRR